MFYPTPTTATLQAIPSGKAGIVATLKEMRNQVRIGKKALTVRMTAANIVQGCGQKDYACEVQMLHAFVRDNIRYIQDVRDVETIHSAEKILEFGYGDCDDKCILLCSMLESIGHPTRFVAIGFQPGIFSHVYCETRVGDSWIPLECTEDVEVGWEPEPKAVMARIDYYN